MSKAHVGIGIIGTGFGLQVQLPGFLGIPEARVIGIAARHPEKSAEIAKKYGLPETFGSTDELLASPEIDLVSIASPQATHEELVHAAIAAGKNVLCEKPFTLSSEAGMKLLKMAEEKKIIHAIDFEFRELPAWQLLHKKLREGSLGPVRSAEFHWIVGTWADPERQWGWQCDASQGGGVLAALGVHLFDAAEWLLGPLTKLFGDTSVLVKERPYAGSTKAVTAEDSAIIEMKTAAGTVIRMKITNVDASGTGLSMTFEGEKGILRMENTTKDYGRGLRVLEGKNIVYTDDTKETGDPRIPSFQSFARRLVQAVQENDRSFRPSFREGVRSQTILEAVRASKGTWIAINN